MKEKNTLKLLKKNLRNHNIIFSLSGETRQKSVKNSLKVLKKYNPENVLIHDSARPLVSNQLIKKIITKLNNNLNCIPYIIHNDYIKTKSKLDNNKIFYIQTPQGFNFKKIYNAHQNTKNINAKDDSILIEQLGLKLKLNVEKLRI